ncbi:Arc family DNA-binding protein [Nevskia sp.]|uniref:Arc family DNA-binding protein n=1 Tax=Nevskia sp. TaxID=1929292 RepID=UPI003457A0D7
MKRSDPQLKVRLPPDLLSWLKDSAERNQRSQNGELVSLLRRAKASETKNPAHP